jgi:hypothetical protein
MVRRTYPWSSSLRAAATVGLLILPGLFLGLICQKALLIWLSAR